MKTIDYIKNESLKAISLLFHLSSLFLVRTKISFPKKQTMQ